MFQKGLPSFWDDKEKLIPQEKYCTLLTQVCMAHSKFEGLDQGLMGETIVNKLVDDFYIFSKSKFHSISYAPCVELQVLIKEMINCEIPSSETMARS